MFGDPFRRAFYFDVLSQRDEVSRDQAAEALGVSRALATFHLERLLRAGLLGVSYRRLTGKLGRRRAHRQALSPGWDDCPFERPLHAMQSQSPE